MGGGEEREGKILEERDRPEEKDARKRRVVCSSTSKEVLHGTLDCWVETDIVFQPFKGFCFNLTMPSSS